MRKWMCVVAVMVLCGMAVAQTALNNAAVIKMHAAGLGDDAIVAIINSQPGSYSLGVDDAIALKTAGIGDKVIAAMAGKSTVTAAPGAAPVANEPPEQVMLDAQSPKVYINSAVFGSNSGFHVTSGNGSSAPMTVKDYASTIAMYLEKNCSMVRVTARADKADYTIQMRKDKKFLTSPSSMDLDDANGNRIYFTDQSAGSKNELQEICNVITKDWGGKHTATDSPEEMMKIGQALEKQGDTARALYWYKMASDKGSNQADVKLGEMYSNLQWPDSSATEAFKWYKKAADAGDADAMAQVGQDYASGNGVKQDYKLATTYYQKSMDSGSIKGTCAMAVAYVNGLGVPRDPSHLEPLYAKATAGGFMKDQCLVGLASALGAQHGPDAAAITNYYRHRAETGDPAFYYELGVMNLFGRNGKMDAAETYFWLDMAEQGGVKAAENLLKTVSAKLSDKDKAAAEEREKDWAAKHPQAVH
jgi:TPR repeat protein